MRFIRSVAFVVCCDVFHSYCCFRSVAAMCFVLEFALCVKRSSASVCVSIVVVLLVSLVFGIHLVVFFVMSWWSVSHVVIMEFAL